MTTSGDGNSKKSRDACDVEAAIDGYLEMLGRHLAGVGYPSPNVGDHDVAHLLTLTRDDLAAMSRDELAEAVYSLNNAAFAVGDEYNRQKAKAERCHTELAKRVGRNLDPSIYNRDDKWMMAASRSSETHAIWLIRRNALTVCSRLEGQAARLSEIAKSINAILYNRS